MSIICGALKWLLDYEKVQKDELTSAISELDEQIKQYINSTDNWFSVQTQQIELNRKRQALQTKLNNIVQYEQKKNSLKERTKSTNSKKKDSSTKFATSFAKDRSEIDKNAVDTNNEKGSIEEELLLEDAEHSESSEDEDKEEIYENIKIFFCSRTHSQLSQFIGELRKSPYSENVSVITLTSRQNYCINKNVKKN